MTKVTVINPISYEKNQYTKSRPRVAAYCRVSGALYEQLQSLSAQIKHYSKFIKLNSEWDFAGIYADEGISGKHIETRNEFIRMIEDCEKGKIDIIDKNKHEVGKANIQKIERKNLNLRTRIKRLILKTTC